VVAWGVEGTGGHDHPCGIRVVDLVEECELGPLVFAPISREARVTPPP
jgi:hypothetical protein